MTDHDTPMMTCDWCGKEFPADPKCCFEGGIDSYHPPEDGDEWKGDEPTQLEITEFSKDQKEEIKREFQIDDEQLEELLRTGKIDGLGMIVCIECQDNAETEPELSA